MRKIFQIFFVVCIIIVGMRGAFEASAARPSQIFGKSWKEMGNDEKTIYLLGVYETVSYIFAFIEPKGQSNDAFVLTAFPMRMQINEQIIALNRFYKDPKNANVPVLHALRIIRMESEGFSSEQVKKWKIYLQEKYK